MLPAAEFARRLREAHEFAALPMRALGKEYVGRTSELKPSVMPWTCHQLDWVPDARWSAHGKLAQLQSCAEQLRHVVARRRALLAARADRTFDATRTQGGRLLLFTPWCCMWNNVAIAVSEGILDDHDEMGWDLWLCIHVDRNEVAEEFGIVAWVPPEFAARVDAAVQTSVEEALSWIEERDIRPWEGA